MSNTLSTFAKSLVEDVAFSKRDKDMAAELALSELRGAVASTSSRILGGKIRLTEDWQIFRIIQMQWYQVGETKGCCFSLSRWSFGFFRSYLLFPHVSTTIFDVSCFDFFPPTDSEGKRGQLLVGVLDFTEFLSVPPWADRVIPPPPPPLPQQEVRIGMIVRTIDGQVIVTGRLLGSFQHFLPHGIFTISTSSLFIKSMTPERMEGLVFFPSKFLAFWTKPINKKEDGWMIVMSGDLTRDNSIWTHLKMTRHWRLMSFSDLTFQTQDILSF